MRRDDIGISGFQGHIEGLYPRTSAIDPSYSAAARANTLLADRWQLDYTVRRRESKGRWRRRALPGSLKILGV